MKRKKMTLKRTVSHGRHFGHLPFRDVRVECFSFFKRCRVKKRKKKERGTKRSSEKMRETNLWNFRAKKEEKGERLRRERSSSLKRTKKN